MTNILALIPARAGSKRIPGKNIKVLGGLPLIAWTIRAAQHSHVFSEIVVCTDGLEIAEIAREHDARSLMRPSSADDEPDIAWVSAALASLEESDAFSLLRPTSPFRTAETIRRAWEIFRGSSWDSMRAVERVRQHPGKMWTLDREVYGGALIPLLSEAVTDASGVPWHSRPIQTLPEVWVQNASLEMAWTARTILRDPPSIAGDHVGPFFTGGYEGFDINDEEDWARAECFITRALPANVHLKTGGVHAAV